MKPGRTIDRLIDIMAALRTPKTGCQWDLEQTFSTIAPYTLEEAYEVVEAVARNDMYELRDELGDLLLQVVFHARIAQEQNAFAFADVVEGITAKLIRRHPHIFGDAKDLSPDEVKKVWNKIKAEEKAQRRAERDAAGYPPDAPEGVLSGVPYAMPALTRAIKLQDKASTVGFDWNDARQVIAKIREETDEIEEALNAGAPQEDVAGEIGDLLFAVGNLARHLKADPEQALRTTNEKFERRFAHIEDALAKQGRTAKDATLEEMDALWDEAKRLERE